VKRARGRRQPGERRANPGQQDSCDDTDFYDGGVEDLPVLIQGDSGGALHVVVHVLYNNDAENISQSQIDSQIEALNRDYRLRNADQAHIPEPFRGFVTDTLIEFALAVRDPQGQATTGITRTFTSMQGFPVDQFDRRATEKLDNWIKHDEFGKAAWPRDSYLNLWTCTIQGGLLGYA
jgi:hypothetical protein